MQYCKCNMMKKEKTLFVFISWINVLFIWRVKIYNFIIREKCRKNVISKTRSTTRGRVFLYI